MRRRAPLSDAIGLLLLLLLLLLWFYTMGGATECSMTLPCAVPYCSTVLGSTVAQAVASLVQAKTPFQAEVRMSNILTMAFKTVKEPALTHIYSYSYKHVHFLICVCGH